MDGNIFGLNEVEETVVKGKWVWRTHPASRQRRESIKAHGGLSESF